MNPNHISDRAGELRKLLSRAKNIAEELHQGMSALEEPALKAQCAVIDAFIFQAMRQEKVLSSVLTTRKHEQAPVAPAI